MLYIINITLSVLLTLNISSNIDDEFESERIRMVQFQIADRGVKDKNVLSAMRKVKRHEFVPESQVPLAYRDRPLPIGYGQTISQPYIVAYMTEMIKPENKFKVLEIGSGSGYQAAILAEITDSVYTIEIIPELYESVKKRFSELGYNNIFSKNADGYYGWKEHAPFDAIIVTAAAEYIPPPLIDQLEEGGKMIIPVGSPYLVQSLMLVEKIKGKVKTKNLMPVRFVPFRRSN